MHKISITCKTCDVSESFYSSISTKRFRLEHVGHEVVEENTYAQTAWRGGEPPNGSQDGERVRLLKVLVELVMLPSYPAPVFTITGVKEDLKSAFVQVVSPSQRDQVRETLEKGKYLDSGPSDTVYVWEPKAITISEGATLAMGFGPSSRLGSNLADPDPAAQEPIQSETSPTSGGIQEIEIAPSGEEQSVLAIDEVSPQTEAPVLVPPEPSDSAASALPADSLVQPEASSPDLAQANAVAAAAILCPEPEASTKPSPESMEASIPASSAEKEAVTMGSSEGSHQTNVEEYNYLLVSRSWYIERGAKTMREAVRVSRLLRPFRWRLEPAYTIGVLVDDVLSVETASGEIGGDMTKQVEGAGYRLSRVSVESGMPVAWFKREPASSEMPLDPEP